MIRYLVLTIFLLFFMLLASSFSFFFHLEFLKPQISIPFIVFSCLFVNPIYSLFLSVFSGFFEEIFSIIPSGSSIFLHVSIFLFIFLLMRRFYMKTDNGYLILCAISFLFQSILFLLFNFFILSETKGYTYVILCIFPGMLSTTLLSFILLPFLKYIWKYESQS